MSRKTDRALKRAAKKTTTAPTVEKVDAAEELSEEEDIPEAVAVEEQEEEDVEEEEENDEEEEEEEDQEEDQEELDEEELEELQAAKAKALRPKINDEAAMIRITEGFKLKDLPWIETMTVTSSKPIEVDVEDDMARELAFYQQALEAVQIGRELIKKAGVDFARPEDYYAEMLKSDEHMAKVRQRLLDESAQVKASEDAKRQRQLKKFGKKVQMEKQADRRKEKNDMLDKIKLLKRKRKDGEDLTTKDDFDIALENADGNKRAKTDKKTPTKGKKRLSKDKKYGFGGKKRFAKSNTAESSDAIGGFNKMRKATSAKGGKRGKR